jgi:transposase
MTQTNITTAGIDTSKLKLDVAIQQRPERWQVSNNLPGWRVLLTNLVKAGVTRVGIEATGGYEGGVVEHLRAAGWSSHRKKSGAPVSNGCYELLMIVPRGP